MQLAVFVIVLATVICGTLGDEGTYKSQPRVMSAMVRDLKYLGAIADSTADPFLDVENEIGRYETEMDLAGIKKIASMFKDTLFKYKNELCLGPFKVLYMAITRSEHMKHVFNSQLDPFFDPQIFTDDSVRTSIPEHIERFIGVM
ncbi:hypothetical protein Q1695_007861 [Nippostrongylus brasiliensis]|nr:hypothetical protein Q1695_007861 [Nippostrongylus brasiliensis]